MRAQLLDAPRPADLLAVVQQLTLLQIDPTAAVAPSADLVAWSRLGSTYESGHLQQALEEDRTLFELDALVRPMSDLGLYLAGAADRPGYERSRAWLRDNERVRRDILDLLARSGPLSSRDIPDKCVVPWTSSGWTNNRNVTQMLEFLMARGEVAIAGRLGRERVWDVAQRVYPADVAVPSVDESAQRKNERRLRSLGIARQTARAMPMEPVHVGEAGEPAVVEGVKGEWRVDPTYLVDDFEGRTALLSPFDRLVHDRVRAQELFEFEYTLEMYKPAAERRWGLLRPSDPPRRPAGREGRRHRRPQGLRAAGARHPRGREVLPHRDQGRAVRAGGPGLVARAGCGRAGAGPVDTDERPEGRAGHCSVSRAVTVRCVQERVGDLAAHGPAAALPPEHADAALASRRRRSLLCRSFFTETASFVRVLSLETDATRELIGVQLTPVREWSAWSARSSTA